MAARWNEESWKATRKGGGKKMTRRRKREMGNERGGERKERRKEGRKFKGERRCRRGRFRSREKEIPFLKDSAPPSRCITSRPFASLFRFYFPLPLQFLPFYLSHSRTRDAVFLHQLVLVVSWKRRFEISSSYRGIISAAGNKQP